MHFEYPSFVRYTPANLSHQNCTVYLRLGVGLGWVDGGVYLFVLVSVIVPGSVKICE